MCGITCECRCIDDERALSFSSCQSYLGDADHGSGEHVFRVGPDSANCELKLDGDFPKAVSDPEVAREHFSKVSQCEHVLVSVLNGHRCSPKPED